MTEGGLCDVENPGISFFRVPKKWRLQAQRLLQPELILTDFQVEKGVSFNEICKVTIDKKEIQMSGGITLSLCDPASQDKIKNQSIEQ